MFIISYIIIYHFPGVILSNYPHDCWFEHVIAVFFGEENPAHFKRSERLRDTRPNTCRGWPPNSIGYPNNQRCTKQSYSSYSPLQNTP